MTSVASAGKTRTHLTLTLPGLSADVSGSLDSYCSLKPLCSGMWEVVPARFRRPYFPHPLALCCHYPVSKCRSASTAMTGTVRVKKICDRTIFSSGVKLPFHMNAFTDALIVHCTVYLMHEAYNGVSLAR